jgi:hypothetical protein
MSSEAPRTGPTANRAVLILGIIAAIAVIAACIMGAYLARSLLQRGPTAEGAEPTPFPQATGQVAPPSQPLILGVSDSDTVSVTLDIPAGMSIGNRQFAVEPQTIAADGIWSPQFASDDSAVWVYGTFVNYVIGLPESEGNRALLEGLAPGQEISLMTRQNVEHRFTFDSRSQVPASDRTVFSQQAPGITVLLLGAPGADRLVVKGRYVVDESANNGGGNSVELGETVQLDDLQIQANDTNYLADRPEAPPGFAFLVIDFTVQNAGLTAVDSSSYNFILRDELGNQYVQNPIASQLGSNPPLTGFVNAGQAMEGTVGYQIPTGLVSPTLTWVIMNIATGSQAEIQLPFTGGEQAGQSAIVSLVEAQITQDLNNLNIIGQITNTASQPVVVTREDVSLRTPTGSDYVLLSSNPPFPWTVPPGQTLQFTVTYQRPLATGEALFTVLNQPFQLSGLQ